MNEKRMKLWRNLRCLVLIIALDDACYWASIVSLRRIFA